MILYDTIVATVSTTNRVGDRVEGPPINVPCQIDPLDVSLTAQQAGSSVLVTRYRLITTTDLEALGSLGSIVFRWKGTRMSLDGGVERHMLMGQLSHVEAFLKVYA